MANGKGRKTRARGQGRGRATAQPVEAKPVESEADMIEKLAQAQQGRARQALNCYNQTVEMIRQQFGFDVQLIITLTASGQVIPDIRLVPLAGWRPAAPAAPVTESPGEPPLVSDNGPGDDEEDTS